jgi:ribose 5-phosphate isomerase B
MKISVGADETHPVVDQVVKALKEQGHEVEFYGPTGKGMVPWPDVARSVALDIAQRHSQEGVLFCWTGTGVSIAANKIPGVRAALCADAETARGARLWNDANVLCFSLRLTSLAIAQEVLKAWLETRYQPNPEDDDCLKLVRDLEECGSHGQYFGS